MQNRVISVCAIRLLSWMDRSHRIGRRASPCVGEATGLVTQKLSADGRGSCYTYTDDGNLATRTWARGVTTSYTYDAWGSLTSTTSSDGTPVATRPLYWQPRTSQGNFSLFYTHDGNKRISRGQSPSGSRCSRSKGNAMISFRCLLAIVLLPLIVRGDGFFLEDQDSNYRCECAVRRDVRCFVWENRVDNMECTVLTCLRRGQSPFELRTDLRIRGGRRVKHRAPFGRRRRG